MNGADMVASLERGERPPPPAGPGHRAASSTAQRWTRRVLLTVLLLAPLAVVWLVVAGAARADELPLGPAVPVSAEAASGEQADAPTEDPADESTDPAGAEPAVDLGDGGAATDTDVPAQPGLDPSTPAAGDAPQPVAPDPVADPPAADPPATDQPATDQPATDQPATDQPATDQPATDQPLTDQPVTVVPVPAAPSAVPTVSAPAVDPVTHPSREAAADPQPAAEDAGPSPVEAVPECGRAEHHPAPAAAVRSPGGATGARGSVAADVDVGQTVDGPPSPPRNPSAPDPLVRRAPVASGACGTTPDRDAQPAGSGPPSVILSERPAARPDQVVSGSRPQRTEALKTRADDPVSRPA